MSPSNETSSEGPIRPPAPIKTNRYQIVALPKLPITSLPSQTDLLIAQSYRALRLHALLTSPSAFASTHLLESARPLEQTLERLRNPKAAHFIVVETNGKEPLGPGLELVANATWLGMVVLLGPQTAAAVDAKVDPFAMMTEDREVETSGGLDFQLNGLFISAELRGLGAGLALLQAALAKAEDITRGRRWRCSVLVDSGNAVAAKLYEKAGFGGVGREAYTQLRSGISEERVALELEVVGLGSR